MEVLAEAFIVAEEECFIRMDRAAKGGAELVALEGRGGALIEEIGGVEIVVTDKFECGAVELVAARAGGDNDLASRALAELGAVRVALDVEFADGVNAEEHAAAAARLHVVFGGAGVFDAVQQENILLGTIARDGEIVGGGGVRDAGAAGLLGREIDDAGIEREEEIVAAAVEGKIVDLLFGDESGDIACGGVDDGSVGDDGDLGFDGADLELKVHAGFLADDQGDTSAEGVLEASFGNADFVLADGKSEDEVAAGIVGGGGAEGAGFNIPGGYVGRGDGGAGGICDEAGDAGGDLGAHHGDVEED